MGFVSLGLHFGVSLGLSCRGFAGLEGLTALEGFFRLALRFTSIGFLWLVGETGFTSLGFLVGLLELSLVFTLPVFTLSLRLATLGFFVVRLAGSGFL